MTRKIDQAGIDHIKKWEGLRTTAYRDDAGIWTIGYGHTHLAGEPHPVKGMIITEEEAEEILRRDLEQFEAAVEQAVKVELTNNQFACLVSFTYNVGTQAFLKSALLKKLNNGQYEAVPNELMKWVFVGKRYTEGLANRRAAEAGLWVKGEFVSSANVKPDKKKENAYLRPETLGPVMAALAGLTGYATGDGPFQWALAFVMVISCLVAVWYFIRRVKRETI